MPDHMPIGHDIDLLCDAVEVVTRLHLRFIAACNHLARAVGWKNVCDDSGASLDDALVVVTRVWATPIDPPAGSDWGIYYGSGNTEATPDAIPMTLLAWWP